MAPESIGGLAPEWPFSTPLSSPTGLPDASAFRPAMQVAFKAGYGHDSLHIGLPPVAHALPIAKRGQLFQRGPTHVYRADQLQMHRADPAVQGPVILGHRSAAFAGFTVPRNWAASHSQAQRRERVVKHCAWVPSGARSIALGANCHTCLARVHATDPATAGRSTRDSACNCGLATHLRPCARHPAVARASPFCGARYQSGHRTPALAAQVYLHRL